MNVKHYILFVTFFCVMIGSLGVVQALHERAQGERVQALDILRDTFITPLERNRTLAQGAANWKRQLATIDSTLNAVLPSDSSGEGSVAEGLAEEALFTLQDIKTRYLAVNSYTSADSSALCMVALDSLYELNKQLYEQLGQGESAQQCQTLSRQLHSRAGSIDKCYSPATPVYYPKLWTEAFFKHSMFSRTYLRAWESKLEKTSVAATTLRPPMQFFRYALMGDVGEKAVGGRDGWIFYKPGYEYLVRPDVADKRSRVVDPNDKPLVDNPEEAIVAFRDELKTRGIDLLVVIVPGKPSIYPDKLNPKLSAKNAGVISHSVQMLKRLQQRGVDVVDLFTPFAAERANDSLAGEPLYLRTDTHWRARGLMLAAQLVAKRVRSYGWYDPSWESTRYAVDTLEVLREGDVGVMTALPALKIRDLALSFGKEPTRAYQVYVQPADSTPVPSAKTLYRDDFRNSKVLLLGDSFSRIYQTDEPRAAGWIAHLARELSQPLATIVSDGGASTLVRRKLAREPKMLRGKKLVIWEFVERDLRFGAEGWKQVAIPNQRD